jgi:hypothetical protein
MPLYYDVTKASNATFTSNGSAGTSSTHLWATTVANQETVGISGLYVAGRFGTAGGAQLQVVSNTGTVASGGTASNITARNLRLGVTAQSLWKDDTSAITIGTTLKQRLSIGWAQTGGTGGWVATEPTNKIQMMPNATNPVDVEFRSVASAASVTFDLSVEFGEGI